MINVSVGHASFSFLFLTSSTKCYQSAGSSSFCVFPCGLEIVVHHGRPFKAYRMLVFAAVCPFMSTCGENCPRFPENLQKDDFERALRGTSASRGLHLAGRWSHVAIADRLRVDWLWEGCRESRSCSRDTYPESCITKYASMRR